MKKHSMLKAVAGAGVLALGIGLAGCAGDRTGNAGGGEEEAGGIIGVAMPTQQSERWIADGNNVKSQLEELGYDVDLQYANDDIPTQVSQIENMITTGAKALIIASIDGTTLTDVLQQAADAGIPVIAYDRPHQRHAQRRLLHDVRQLQGRRAAGHLAPHRPRRARRLGCRHGCGGSVQRRAVRR